MCFILSYDFIAGKKLLLTTWFVDLKLPDKSHKVYVTKCIFSSVSPLEKNAFSDVNFVIFVGKL